MCGERTIDKEGGMTPVIANNIIARRSRSNPLKSLQGAIATKQSPDRFGTGSVTEAIL